MAKTRSSGTKPNRRGSPEAVEKRRTARALNTLLSARSTGSTRDLRTERRRKRLLEELAKGRRGRPLKPIEVLQHANDLLDMGESLTAIKRAAGAKHKLPMSDDAEDVVRKTQEAYGFDPRGWDVVGARSAVNGADPEASEDAEGEGAAPRPRRKRAAKGGARKAASRSAGVRRRKKKASTKASSSG